MFYLEGLLFGLVLQLSVGPVFIGVLNQAISRGFKEAFKMVLGVALVDSAYISASVLGVSQLLNILFLRKVLLIAGALVLIYIGFTHLTRFGAAGSTISPRVKNSLSYGIKLTLTNPLTIIFWTSTLGSLAAANQLAAGALFLFAAGCVTATMLFLGSLSLAGNFASRLMQPKAVIALDRVVGLFLICFGLSLLLR
jgi:threonine/homoserine/homoserine lactone efflux protein